MLLHLFHLSRCWLQQQISALWQLVFHFDTRLAFNDICHHGDSEICRFQVLWILENCHLFCADLCVWLYANFCSENPYRSHVLHAQRRYSGRYPSDGLRSVSFPVHRDSAALYQYSRYDLWQRKCETLLCQPEKTYRLKPEVFPCYSLRIAGVLFLW